MLRYTYVACLVFVSLFSTFVQSFIFQEFPFLFVYIYPSRSVLLTQYCAGGKMERNVMGRACGAYGGGERCAQGFGGEA
jgi:hypothetical protein